jgi:hypothetical protein
MNDTSAWLKLDYFQRFVRDNKENTDLNEFVQDFIDSIPDNFSLPKQVTFKLKEIDHFVENQVGGKIGHNNNIEQDVTIDIDYTTLSMTITLSEKRAIGDISFAICLRRNFYDVVFKFKEMIREREVNELL